MIEVREVRPDEYAAAGDVAVEGYRDFYREALGSYADRLRDVATRSEGAVVLVAVEDDEVVGTVTYVPDATSDHAHHQLHHEASIRMLSIAPKHKRRGIGTMLSVACIDRARTEGKRAVSLHADEIMEGACRLYERLGFVRDPDRDYRPDDETFLVCYMLEL